MTFVHVVFVADERVIRENLRLFCPLINFLLRVSFCWLYIELVVSKINDVRHLSNSFLHRGDAKELVVYVKRCFFAQKILHTDDMLVGSVLVSLDQENFKHKAIIEAHTIGQEV